MKTTKAQALPWKKCTLGDIIKLQRGFDLPGRLRRAGQIPIVSSSGITDYHQIAAANGPGVVTGRYGTIGEVFYVEGDYWPLNTTLYVKDFKGNSPLFISHLLKTVDFASHSGKSGVPGVNRNDLHELEISLPPLAEQNAIASALSDMDALLAKLDQLIAKKRDIKQAAMQEFFEKPAKNWTSRKLADISAFITKGSTPTTYGFNWETSGILFLRSECVSDAGIDLTQSMHISSEAHAVLKRSEVLQGDLLMTITGNVGRVVQATPECDGSNINQHIARIRINDPQINSIFVYHYFSQRRVRKDFEKITTGQAYPQLSLAQVRDCKIPMPDLPKQNRIAGVLSDMDTEITALEARREKTRLIKQGMMQELLSGRKIISKN